LRKRTNSGYGKNVGGFTYDSRDEFLQQQVLIDYNLTEQMLRDIVNALKRGSPEQPSQLSPREEVLRAFRRLSDEDKAWFDVEQWQPD